MNARIAWLLALVCGCALQYTVPLDDDEQCDGDACMPECEAGDPCDGVCVELASDAANCGMCGRWCDNDEVCQAGQCVRTCEDSCDDTEQCVDGECECRPGYTRCDDDDEGECVDLLTDDGNCGVCDRGCNGQPCGGGECLDEDCAPWPDRCEHACTDVQDDPVNCGACGRECHATQSCVDGECTSPS